METSRSPWKVIREAHRLATQAWPAYSDPCSRHDFTLPQLFACLVIREMLKLSYRKAEALLRDSPHWLADIGMDRAPDHNTLWRASGLLLKGRRVNTMLDLFGQLLARRRLLRLSLRPLSIDSTCYEPHHRSRHYDRVCRKLHLRRGEKYGKRPGKWGNMVNRSRSRKLRRMPKLALAVAAGCHAVLAAVPRIGNGSDAPDFAPLLRQSRRRGNIRTVVADGGYDSEGNHRLARLDLGARSIIPAVIGRPSAKPPTTRYRRLMKRRFARKADRRIYGQRAQSETVNSMMKRNFGESLRSRLPARQKQEMMLRVLTHNILLWCST